MIRSQRFLPYAPLCLAALLLGCLGAGAQPRPSAERPAVTAADHGVDFSEKILWMKADHSEPMFLPEKVLNSTARLEDLPLTKSQLEDLGWSLRFPDYLKEYNKRTGRHERVCSSPPKTDPKVAGAPSLQEQMRSEPVVVAGTVLQVVPGWSGWIRRAVRMVYLKVDTVVRQKGMGTLKKGVVLAYDEPTASIIVKGIEICEEAPPDFFRAVEGARVLVLGGPTASPDVVLSPGFVFPVVDGKVLGQPYPAIREFDSIPLSELLARGRGGAPE